MSLPLHLFPLYVHPTNLEAVRSCWHMLCPRIPYPQPDIELGHGVLDPRGDEHKRVGNDGRQQESYLEQRDDLVLTLGVKNETMNVQQSHRFHWLGWPWNMGGIHVWDLFGSSSFSIACAYNFSPHVPFFPNPHLSCRYYITSLLSFS